jgi:serine/threonine protein kinase
LRPDQAEDERALRDLAAEAELLERLSHPVILRGFDAVLDGPHPHILIEHLEGPPLRRLIKRGGPAPLDQLLPLALHVASAIHYLSRMDVVHLDVKPDNIIMGVPPRLIDMSVARTSERAARMSGPIGTDAYMAPEQCDPRGEWGVPGAPADVWGLGATLHHAASGHKPFPRKRDARDSEVLEVRFPQLVAEPRQLPERLPEDLRELIGEMMSPAPEQRPTAAEVAERLEPLVATMPAKLAVTRTGLQPKIA